VATLVHACSFIYSNWKLVLSFDVQDIHDEHHVYDI
jgi:hypothetical protein